MHLGLLAALAAGSGLTVVQGHAGSWDSGHLGPDPFVEPSLGYSPSHRGFAGAVDAVGAGFSVGRHNNQLSHTEHHLHTMYTGNVV